jgi:hypothetical protein
MRKSTSPHGGAMRQRRVSPRLAHGHGERCAQPLRRCADLAGRPDAREDRGVRDVAAEWTERRAARSGHPRVEEPPGIGRTD